MLQRLLLQFIKSNGRKPNNLEMILLRQKASKEAVNERKIVNMFDRQPVDANKPILGGKNIIETDEQMIQRFKNQNKEAVERLKNKKEPEDMAGGGVAGLLGERPGYKLGDIVKENIPPEYRLYLKSILPGGEEGKVDESYFTKKFKKELRSQALSKFLKTGKTKGIVTEGDQHRGDPTVNKLLKFPSTYASLGTYTYDIDPKTMDVKITDKYDWNPAYGSKSIRDKRFTGYIGDKKGTDVDLNMFKDFAVDSLRNKNIDKESLLEMTGNYFGGKQSEGKGFDVDIDIPMEEATTATEGSFAKGGIAGYYTGGMVDVEPNLSDIGHGSDALMARTRLVAPDSQATTSTGLNYLLAEDNDNIRVPFENGGDFKQFQKEKMMQLMQEYQQYLKNREIEKRQRPYMEKRMGTGPGPILEAAEGGRIGFAAGGRVAMVRGGVPKGLQAAMRAIMEKYGKDSIKTVEDTQEFGLPYFNIDRPEKAIARDKFKNFGKEGKFAEDGTPDYDYYADLLNHSEDTVVFGDETIEELEALAKPVREYQESMYDAYKTRKLDPEAGSVSQARLNFLRRNLEEAEMTGDRRLISQDEIEELDYLEDYFRKDYLDFKAQQTDRKMTQEEIEELKELGEKGFKDGGLVNLTAMKIPDNSKSGVESLFKRR